MKRVEEMFTSNNQISSKQLSIICCLPGSSFSGTFLERWYDFSCVCFQKGIEIIMSHAEDAVVYYVRNKCLGGDVRRGENQKPFDGKINYDYMLWIDSDIAFIPQNFATLINRNVDIVGGIYMMKGGQQFAAVKTWDEEYFKKNGTFQFFEEKDIEGKKDLIEVDYSGFGFMLIKKGVFESLKYPWFEPITYRIGNYVDFCSEDVAFCRKAKEKGYKIYIDPTVRVGHEKRLII